MPKITRWEYERLVIRRATKRAWDTLGAWGTVLGVAAAVIAALIIERPNSISDIGGSEAFLALVLIVGIADVVLLLCLSDEPAKIYNEQALEIEKWESKYGGQIIVSDKIQCKAESIEFGDKIYARLLLKNEEYTDFAACYAVLITLQRKTKKGWEECSGDFLYNNTLFRWPVNESSIWSIPRNVTEFLSVARVERGSICFTFGDGDSPWNDKSGDFYIEIDIHGRLEGKLAQTKRFQGHIKHTARYRDNSVIDDLEFYEGPQDA